MSKALTNKVKLNAAPIDTGVEVLVSEFDSLADAIATGRDVNILDGVTVSGANIVLSTAKQRIFGNGTIVWDDASQHLFNVQADDVEISVARINGTATSEANTTFAVFTDVSNPAARTVVSGVLFSGATAGVGCNNAIKFDDGCDDGLVENCTFERLWGTSSGHGYCVLVGNADNVCIQNNKASATVGRGRHAFYLSAGASNCRVVFNLVSGFQYEGITINSQGIQPPCTNNLIGFNAVEGCCTAIPGVSSGGISIFGHALQNKIIGNHLKNNAGDGIKLDGTGVVDLAQTEISENTVVDNDYIGIHIVAGVSGRLSNNTLNENSRAVVGTYPNIGFFSDGTTATSDWFVNGNRSSGTVYARSAFQLNSTPPVPSNLKVYGNRFDLCNLADIEYGGTSCAIDGRIRYSGTLDVPSLANGASHTAVFTVAGAAMGDLVSTTLNISNMDGYVMTGYVDATNSVTVVVLNASGGTVDLVSSPINIDVYKRTP